MSRHNLASIKRRIRPGVSLLCIRNTLRPELDGTLRRVTRVQGNGFWWTCDRDPREAWTDYPPASGVVFVDDDTFRFPLGEHHHVELQVGS